MSVVVDGVPALTHISLFFFLLGLAEFIFSLYTSMTTATTITIAIVLLYVWTIIAPVHAPQSPILFGNVASHHSSCPPLHRYVPQLVGDSTHPSPY
jgi:hypothetical protein